MTDGTKIAERWAWAYGKTESEDLREAIRQLSRSEERERVLREALENLRGAFVVVCAPTDPNSYARYREAKAALSTPAPKQRYRLNSGQCAAQVVDCDCRRCRPELEDMPAPEQPAKKEDNE